jgi:hypothetical protein
MAVASALRLTRNEQLQIGRAVLIARRNRVKWKVLKEIYNLGRTRLWMLAREAEAADQVRAN